MVLFVVAAVIMPPAASRNRISHHNKTLDGIRWRKQESRCFWAAQLPPRLLSRPVMNK